jgi:hypothetical protein
MAWATPISPLAHGEILDAGCEYHEFMASDSFAAELMAGGMTHINGERVTLHIVDELPGIGAVTLRWTPAALDAEDEAA